MSPRFTLPFLSSLASAVALLCALAPGQALATTSATHTVDMVFTLTGVEFADGSGPVDPFLLGDLFINGFAETPAPGTFMSGSGAFSGSTTPRHNGTPLGPFDDFVLGLGDSFDATQVATTSVGASGGQGTIFQDLNWILEVENQIGDDVVLLFDWSYVRPIDLAEMGTGDSTAVFLEASASVDDFEGFFDQMDFIPDPTGNIGTLPPGIMTTFSDSGSFSLFANGTSTTYSEITIAIEVGATSNAPVPEPGTALLAAIGLLVALRRRRTTP